MDLHQKERRDAETCALPRHFSCPVPPRLQLRKKSPAANGRKSNRAGVLLSRKNLSMGGEGSWIAGGSPRSRVGSQSLDSRRRHFSACDHMKVAATELRADFHR